MPPELLEAIKKFLTDERRHLLGEVKAVETLLELINHLDSEKLCYNEKDNVNNK